MEIRKDINKLSDVELAFEYRELRENLGWEKEHDRYTDVEREIVSRELRRRNMEGVGPRDSMLPGLTGSYPGKTKKPLVGVQMAKQVLEILKPNTYPDLNEFVIGINDELGEHAGTIHKFARPGYDELEAAGMIALDHLAENPRWYSEAKKAGL